VTLSPAVGNAPTPATPPATLGASETASTNTAKKYQYWSVKVKPYLETQLSIQNKIFIDQLLQVDLNFDITSFKSFFSVKVLSGINMIAATLQYLTVGELRQTTEITSFVEEWVLLLSQS